jgi:hypothetical protein
MLTKARATVAQQGEWVKEELTKIDSSLAGHHRDFELQYFRA